MSKNKKEISVLALLITVLLCLLPIRLKPIEKPLMLFVSQKLGVKVSFSRLYFQPLNRLIIQDLKISTVFECNEVVLHLNPLKYIIYPIKKVNLLSKIKLKMPHINTLELKSLKSRSSASYDFARPAYPYNIEIKDDIVSKASVMADPTQIHQVIMNLCTNAYHAMRDTGGLLTVTLKEIKVPGPDNIAELNMLPGHYLRLEVSDTGSGIHPDIMDKIFDPYFSTKTPDKGTGLGLAVVHGIIRDSNGYIKVYSNPGQGTSFYVFLPVAKEKADSDNTQDKNDFPAGGTEKIMVVDDEENIRNSMAEFLADLGYEVSAYANGRDAREAFMKNPGQVDFIISDITMPLMTGDALAANILKSHPDLPIILCSGYSDKISENTLRNTGIYKCLDKPVSLENLAFIIREKLDERSRG